MSFMMKKKKYKFQVDFELEELSAVPFVNAVLFAKIRLLEGGTFTDISSREEVVEHCIKWGAKFNFVCKMSANANTGVLEPCSCRISIRKELKGGRSFQKLGFADVNLAEFAGSGVMTRRYLLEGYDAKRRQDNSILKVTLQVTLLSGDPCFKAPTWKVHSLPGECPEERLQPGERKPDEYSGGSVTSGSSGVGSLPRKKDRPSVFNSDLVNTSTSWEGESHKDSLEDFELGHSRNSSYTSQQSKASGYSSLHSRQGSSESGHNRNPSWPCGRNAGRLCRSPDVNPYDHTHVRQSSLDFVPGHIRNTSTGSSYGEGNPSVKVPDRKWKQLSEELKESRVDSTRVDADELINELIEATNLDADESAETSGLQLYIAKDGTAALGGHELKHRMTAGVFEPVVIGKR